VQTITVAVTANPLMTTIENLTPGGFEASHPDIKVKFVTYDENTERAEVEKDVAAHGGQFDVVMIGPNDIANWAANGWIDSLNAEVAADPSYDVNDLLPPIRSALTSKGQLYALPFYGESSFMMYNKKIFAADGLTMPANPTWAQIATLAAKADDPSKNVAGICLRGLTGWGDNLATLDTVINTMGGAWFDKNWNAELTSPATEAAVNFYVNLVRADGEKGAGNDSFDQCLNIFEQGQAAMWYDATVGASTVDAPGSPIDGDVGFAAAPVDRTASSGWLWTWALALESSSKHQSAAEQFMDWATSQQYIEYDASKNGWASVPPGTRTSTYENPNYQKAAGDFAALTLKELDSVNIDQPGLAPQPVPGVQYVGVPEFEDFGEQVSAQITAAIDGQESVSQALSASQQIAQQAVVNAGYKS
jgi:sorbitol/mannitol transport system substrate-binding protein